jgi:hypothetical protein
VSGLMLVEAKLTFWVTIAYILLFLLTFGIIMPYQYFLLTQLPLNISLLFLPHGVRIITVYLYGWKSIFYLLPGHLVTWAYLNLFLHSKKDMYSSLISILCSFFAVSLMFWSWTSHPEKKAQAHWKLIMAAGALASAGNGLGHALLYGDLEDAGGIKIIVGYMIGDISGLFFLLLVLIIINKYMRKIVSLGRGSRL